MRTLRRARCTDRRSVRPGSTIADQIRRPIVAEAAKGSLVPPDAGRLAAATHRVSSRSPKALSNHTGRAPEAGLRGAGAPRRRAQYRGGERGHQPLRARGRRSGLAGRLGGRAASPCERGGQRAVGAPQRPSKRPAEPGGRTPEHCRDQFQSRRRAETARPPRPRRGRGGWPREPACAGMNPTPASWLAPGAAVRNGNRADWKGPR